MSIRPSLLLTAVLAMLPAVASAQLRVEPQIGVLFGRDLARNQISDLNGTFLGNAHLARHEALILGLRLAYPLTPRLSVVASYASAATALNFDVEPSVPGGLTGFDSPQKFLFLSTQASLELTPPQSSFIIAASAGAARVGMGTDRFSLDGWWGGVLGMTVGFRLSTAAAVMATQEIYLYKTDMGQKHEYPLRLGLSLTPWH